MFRQYKLLAGSLRVHATDNVHQGKENYRFTGEFIIKIYKINCKDTTFSAKNYHTKKIGVLGGLAEKTGGLGRVPETVVEGTKRSCWRYRNVLRLILKGLGHTV